jgi:hypothetical protein
MRKEITIEYTPNVETLMKVSKYLLLQLRFVKFLPLFFLIFLIPFIVRILGLSASIPALSPFFIDEEVNDISDILTVLIVLGIWIFIYFKTLSTMKKNILNNKRNLETQKITFNEVSYLQEAFSFKIENFWNETLKIVETKEWFLIYQKENMAFPIVKSTLDDNEYKHLKKLFSSLSVKKKLL